MSNTRRKTEIFGLGEGITEDGSVITGSRLPTFKQILICFIYHLQVGENNTTYSAARKVYELTIPFYLKGGIPMLADKTCCQKIEKLWQENRKLRKIPETKRSLPSVLVKLEEYKKDIDKTFSLWNAKAESLVKNVDDLKFLQSMKTDRAATFGGFDQVLKEFHQRVDKRREDEARRKKKALEEIVSYSNSFHRRRRG